MAGVRAWIDRLGLSIAEAAHHVGLESDQLERILEFPDKNLSVRALLEILEGLGLGLVGVEALTPVAILRHLDQIREAKGMTKKDLALKAEVNRPWLIALFQERKPEPKLETILKLARVLEVDLVIEKRRELPPLEPLPAQAQPAWPASSPTTTPAAAASTPPSPGRPVDDIRSPNGTIQSEQPAPTEIAAGETQPAQVAPRSTATPPQAAAADRPAASSTAPPRAAAANRPAASSTIPPQAAATDRPPTSSTAPPRVAAADRPAAASTTPPQAAATDRPPTSSTAPPTSSTAPPRAGAADRPAASSTTPPQAAATDRPAASSTAPPQAAAAERPAVSASPPPAATDRPAASSTAPPQVAAADRPAASTTTSPRAAVAEQPAASSTAPPRAAATGHPAASPTASPRSAGSVSSIENGENAKRAPAAANEPPRGSDGTTTAATAAAAAAMGVTVATGRWVTDAAFTRMNDQLADARTQLAEEQHKTAMARKQVEHERQLAEQQAAQQVALEQLADRDAALRSNVVLGGTATAAVVGGSTALAFVSPENRHTAQAALSIAGGTLSIAGAMAERNSRARGVLLGAGGGMLLAALIDLIRQSASPRGGLAGITCRRDALPNFVIETVAPRSNAAQAGLIQGDVIISVDGVSVQAIGARAAYERTKGELGTILKLVVVRDYFEMIVDVVRAPI